jgi:tetratricopeptide (TPR) repeat protein
MLWSLLCKLHDKSRRLLSRPRNAPAHAAAFLLLLISALLRPGQTHAQSGTPLGTEIQNLEQSLSVPNITPAERQEALLRLARLRQLSGDIEGAAKNWLEAAAAQTGSQSGQALVSAAYCLAAMGEWERAAAALAPLLADGQGRPLLHARYLEACIAAWKTGDSSVLGGLAVNPDFAELRPSIYYTLWKTLAAEPWKTRLLAEYPNSPEGRIAASEGSGGAINAAPSPMWLLLPGRGGFTLNAPAAPPAPVQEPPPAKAAVSPPAPPAASGGAAAGKTLQTGLFKSEANARAQAEQLKKAGFSPAVTSRTVNGVEHWTVTVPAGTDSSRTMRELKTAGFDSFPASSG